MGMAPTPHRVRLVVQFVGDPADGEAGYRLIVYPAPRQRPLLFSSREILIERLQGVIPAFDARQIPTLQPNRSQIVYTGNHDLSEAQFAALSLSISD
jgi:hypothetical protein